MCSLADRLLRVCTFLVIQEEVREESPWVEYMNDVFPCCLSLFVRPERRSSSGVMSFCTEALLYLRNVREARHLFRKPGRVLKWHGHVAVALETCNEARNIENCAMYAAHRAEGRPFASDDDCNVVASMVRGIE